MPCPDATNDVATFRHFRWIRNYRAILEYVTEADGHAYLEHVWRRPELVAALPREVQDAYVERALGRARRGYVTYNRINPAEFRSLTPKELCGIAPGARSEPEVPLTHPGNCIITWGPAATLPT